MTDGWCRDPFGIPGSTVPAMAAVAPTGRPVPRGAAVDPRAAAAVAGDREAARGLLLDALPRVRNLVRCLVRGDAEVDDMAQEALVNLLRGLGGYRGEGSFESWADRVVARTVFARLRRRRGERQRAAPIGADLIAVEDAGAGAEEYVARRRAVRALDELPFDQRNAVVLHHVLGMSVPEIAAETEVPMETVRSRLRLGMRRLREIRAPATGAPEEV